MLEWRFAPAAESAPHTFPRSGNLDLAREPRQAPFRSRSFVPGCGSCDRHGEDPIAMRARVPHSMLKDASKFLASRQTGIRRARRIHGAATKTGNRHPGRRLLLVPGSGVRRSEGCAVGGIGLYGRGFEGPHATRTCAAAPAAMPRWCRSASIRRWSAFAKFWRCSSSSTTRPRSTSRATTTGRSTARRFSITRRSRRRRPSS